MRELMHQRATVVVGLLIVVTGVSYWLSVGHGAAGFHEAQSIVWAQVLVLAFVKVRWILLDFMELRAAPTKLRLLLEVWVVCVAAVLILVSLLNA